MLVSTSTSLDIDKICIYQLVTKTYYLCIEHCYKMLSLFQITTVIMKLLLIYYQLAEYINKYFIQKEIGVRTFSLLHVIKYSRNYIQKAMVFRKEFFHCFTYVIYSCKIN